MTVGYSSSLHLENSGWKKWDLDSVNNLTSLHFFNDTVGIVCGLNGKIYKTISGGVPASTSELVREEIKLYPNPASSFINLGNEFTNSEINVYSSNGQLVKNEIITSPKLNLTDLKAGLYFIKIYSDNKIQTGRFIKK